MTPWHPWWLWPLAMCIVLTGIHGYLGLHVIARKVIFVDLAMAQIAALGAAFAVLLGYDPREDANAVAIHLFSLGFTLAGAGLFALIRMKREKVPQEAFIGIVYAGASAVTILMLSKSPLEGQIEHMLVGSLLTVRGRLVAMTAVIYAAILAFHWAFRERFFAISQDPEAAEKAGIRVRRWDFLFYTTFGVVITSSVAVAGVLLVFSYLVVPAVIAVMFAARTASRVALCWTVGTGVSVAGMIVSYQGEVPTGPAIVASFVGVLIVAGLAHYVLTSERSGVAAGRLAAGAAVVALALAGAALFLRKGEKPHKHEEEFNALVARLHSGDETLQIEAVHHFAELADIHAVDHLIGELRQTRSDRVIEHIAEALAKLGDARAAPALLEVAAREDLDGFLRASLAKAVLRLRDARGFPILIGLLEREPMTLPRDEAKKLVEEFAGLRLDYATDKDPSENRAALEGLRAWWSQRGASLRWRGQTKRFE